jgi:hypothetical protein
VRRGKPTRSSVTVRASSSTRRNARASSTIGASSRLSMVVVSAFRTSSHNAPKAGSANASREQRRSFAALTSIVLNTTRRSGARSATSTLPVPVTVTAGPMNGA